MRRAYKSGSYDEFLKVINNMKQVEPGVWVSREGKVIELKAVDDSGYDKIYYWIEPSISINNIGYAQLGVNGRVTLVHRLVAKAYIPNPDNLREVNHIDGDKLNNNVENLEWISHSENMKAAWKNGQFKNAGSHNIHGKYYRSTGTLTMPDGKKIQMSLAEYIEYRKKNKLRVTADMLN